MTSVPYDQIPILAEDQDCHSSPLASPRFVFDANLQCQKSRVSNHHYHYLLPQNPESRSHTSLLRHPRSCPHLSQILMLPNYFSSSRYFARFHSYPRNSNSW